MKKIILTAFAVAALIPTASFAAANPASNGVNKNCFGQGRSEYSNGTNRPPGYEDRSTGDVISERAQSDATNPQYPNGNVEANKEYKAGLGLCS